MAKIAELRTQGGGFQRYRVPELRSKALVFACISRKVSLSRRSLPLQNESGHGERGGRWHHQMLFTNLNAKLPLLRKPLGQPKGGRGGIVNRYIMKYDPPFRGFMISPEIRQVT